MKPKLLITPTIWSKILFLAELGDTEVSGFGLTEYPDEPFTITDFRLVKQTCTRVTTEMEDESVMDHILTCTEQGLQPHQCGRIWIHTHPEGCGTTPSHTDKTTFKESFGGCDWAIMVIVNVDQKVSGLLRISKPVEIEMPIDIEIDYGGAFEGTDFDTWEKEYDVNIFEAVAWPAIKTTTPKESNAASWESTEYYNGLYAKEDAIYAKYIQGIITEAEYDQEIENLYITGAM